MSIFSSIKVSVPASAAFAVAVVIFSALSASFLASLSALFILAILANPAATTDFLASLSALAVFDFLYLSHSFMLMGPSLFLAANSFLPSLSSYLPLLLLVRLSLKSALIFFLKFACNAASILGSIFSSRRRLKVNVRIGLESLLWMGWTS